MNKELDRHDRPNAESERPVRSAEQSAGPQTDAASRNGKDGRPEGLPRKFWDEKAGQIRIDALVRSYLEIERKLGERHKAPPLNRAATVPGPDAPDEEKQAFRKAMGVPDSPDEYRIELLEDFLERDPEVDRVLHQAGFTDEQAQLVYDLAAEKLAPVMTELARQSAGHADQARLEAHFGGRERWSEVRRQLRKWAERHLPPDAYGALAASYDGVLAMHRMMSPTDEPGVLNGAEGGTGPSEEQLRRMIRDPRYWRDRDPKLMKTVSQGYKRLYPDKG